MISSPLLSPYRSSLRRFWIALSGVSVRTKIMGIVLGIVLILGIIITLQVRATMRQTLIWELIVRFIEYMDAGNLNGWQMDDVVPAQAILARIDAALPLVPVAPNYVGEVAKRYRYLDGSGEIGLVTSVTRPFCGDCSRIRLTASGELYTCLFGGTAVFEDGTAVPPPTAVHTTQTKSPIVDGVLSPGEWDTAVIENLSDGSELLLIQDEDYLYLGVRSVTPEMIGANVFLAAGEQVRILHTSAALGTAVYQQNGDAWQQTQDFDWRCRSTGDSTAAQAERAAYLQENHWLAANCRMGTPDELEFQIQLTGALPRIAVSVFRSSAPDERVFWPPTLDDDIIRPNPGGLPAKMDFAPEKWAAGEWQ